MLPFRRKVVPKAPKGGKRPKAANYRNAISPYESKGIQPEPACSRKPIADCLHLYPYRLLPADWYLAVAATLSAFTEILRLRLRMTMRAGRQYRNVGSFPRKELPDRAEDRSEYMQEHVYLTNQAPAGPRIFYENPAIIRRLRRHLLPEEEGSGSSSCSSGDTNVNPVTLTSYSSPKAIPSPLNPLNLLNPLNPAT